jgi:hypothetical protein
MPTPLEVCLDYVDSVTCNIECFLKDKPRQMTLELESIEETFPAFWESIGAERVRDAAMKEWSVSHNAS